MKKLPLVSISFALGFAVSGCVSSYSPSNANLEPPMQGSAAREAMDANAVRPPRSNIRGWISADATKSLLYVSDVSEVPGGPSQIDIFSVPKYHLVGQITDGLDNPDGLAIDQNGTLYVANLWGLTVTVYKHGQITPSLTLSDPYKPDAVAVAKNGYVLVGDVAGGVAVYAPGTTSLSARLTNPALAWVDDVAVDANNNVYAAGNDSHYHGAVIKYAKMSGPGKNLGLLDLSGEPSGVLQDGQGDFVVSDATANVINIYPPGQKSPSSTISIGYPVRSAFNEKQNYIYVPQGGDNLVSIFTYPGGSRVKWIEIGGFAAGAALYPAATP